VGCPVSTLQSLELGRRNLTEEMAVQVSNATNVHLGWLLNGDPNAPIIDQEGNPYDPVQFEVAQGNLLMPKSSMSQDMEEAMIDFHAADLIVRFRKCFLQAGRSGRWQLFVWRVSKVFDQTEEECKRADADTGARERFKARYLRALRKETEEAERILYEKRLAISTPPKASRRTRKK